MCKRMFFLLGVLLVSTSLLGQRFRPHHKLGVQLGINSNSFSISQIDPKYPYTLPVEEFKNGNSFEGGFYYGYHFAKLWSAETGLGYTARSAIIGGSTLRKIHTLQIPLTINIHPLDWIRVGTGINAQLYMGEIEGAKDKYIDNKSLGFFEWTANVKFKIYKGLGLGINYGLGLTPAYTQVYTYWGEGGIEAEAKVETSNQYFGFTLFYDILYLNQRGDVKK